MDLRRQLGIVRKWFPLLVASVLLAAGAAFAFSSMQQKVYQAKATLIVGQSLSAVNPDYNQLMVSQRLSTTYAAVATKRPILDSVIKELGLTQTSDELAFRVWADAPTDSTLLNLTAQDSDPARAAAIANAMAEQLIAASPAIQGRQTDLQKSIDADLKATQDQINAIQAQMESLAGLASPKPADLATLETLQSRLITLRSTYAALLSNSVGNSSNLLEVVEPAVAPTSPVSPKPLLYTLLAAVAGLLLAAGVVAVVEYLDDTVKDADTVQEVAGLSTLGSITRMESERGRSEIYTLATVLYPRSPAAEAYRTLRANIEFASVAASVHTLLVTSANAGEGKTVTAANLAVAFAQAGRPVLLVDADLRKPGVHRIFDVPNMHGLTSLLRSDDVSLDAVAHPTEQANLRLLTSGPLPPNPAELLGSQRMRTILERLKAGADLVIFDAAPLQAVTDSAIMSSYLDATILVVDSGHTRRGALRQGRDILARAGANVLGVILNRLPKAAQSGYYRAYGDQDFREMAVGQDPSVTEASPKGSA